MSFPPSFLEEIRNRLSVSGVVGSRVRLVRAGREFKGCCPFHNEKTPSFYVNDDKQFFHCFGCGAHGDVIGFTMRNGGMSFPEAVENLAAIAGLPVPQDTPVQREQFDREKHLYQLLDRATSWFEEQLFSSAGREALAYLHKRGLSDDAIRRFRLGYAPTDAQALLKKMAAENFKADDLVAVGLAKKAEDRNEHYSFFRNRVIFPVGDRRGRTVAFGARILGEGEPKYLNSPDHALFHKGKLLYGLSRARAALAQGQPIIVVEGYMDVIALAEAGYTGAVAPLGTALTEDQMQILWKLLPPPDARQPSRDYSPILCFDGDPAGQRATARVVERALPLLTSAQTLRFIKITGAKDPDELIRKSGKASFDALLKQASSVFDKLLDITLEGRQTDTPTGRNEFEQILFQRVNQIKDDNLRRLCGTAFRKFLNDSLRPQPQNANQNNYGKSGYGKNKNITPPFLGTRKAPQSGQRMMEKILLALMINHPDLFDEFGENLAHLDFQTPEFDHLRRRLVELLSHGHDEQMTASELRRALADHGEERIAYEDDGNALDEILSPATYMHAKGAQPEADADLTRQTWLSTWGLHEQDVLKAELNEAIQRHRNDDSKENWDRINALRTQIEQSRRVVGGN